jgi:hypothetical protein
VSPLTRPAAGWRGRPSRRHHLTDLSAEIAGVGNRDNGFPLPHPTPAAPASTRRSLPPKVIKASRHLGHWVRIRPHHPGHVESFCATMTKDSRRNREKAKDRIVKTRRLCQ